MENNDVVEKIRLTVEAWAAKQSHERCWYYPDIFMEIAHLVNAKVDYPANLPPRQEFEEGCCRYQKEQYDR